MNSYIGIQKGIYIPYILGMIFSNFFIDSPHLVRAIMHFVERKNIKNPRQKILTHKHEPKWNQTRLEKCRRKKYVKIYKIFWKISNLKKKVMVSPKVVNWQWYEPSNDMYIFAFIYYRCAATLLLILSLPYSPTDWLTHLMILKILLQTFRWLWHWHGLQIRRGKILKAWPWHFPQYYFKNAPC